MYNSWYFVRELALKLNKILSGCLVQTPFTYKKNELYLPFNGANYQCLHFVSKAPVPYFMPESNIPKEKQVVKILKPISGCTVHSVMFHRNDRQILFNLNTSQLFLIIQMFGVNSNIFLMDKNFSLLDVFKKRKKYDIPEQSDFRETIATQSPINFDPYFKQYENKSVYQFLKLLPYQLYSGRLRCEILYRASLDKSSLVYNLSKPQKDCLSKEIMNVIKELDQHRYYFYDTDPPKLSLLPLSFLTSHKEEKFNDFFDLQRYYVSRSFRTINFDNRKAEILTKVKNYFQLLEKRIHKSHTALTQLPNSEHYRKKGNSLLTHLHQISQGQKKVLLPDLTDMDQQLSITLDPALPIAKNADQYFQKATKTEIAKKELQERTRQLQLEKEQLLTLVNKLETIDSYQALKGIEKNLPKAVLHQEIKEESNVRQPYKKFFFKNWDILVGKSARDNDQLTFKVAAKSDFWLHAANVPGSHVIVRNPVKNETMPSDILHYAAGIAAFYSKNKHSKLVSVNYTRKKYVWKRKKMAPGQVFIKFEKTVFVEPLDPTGK